MLVYLKPKNYKQKSIIINNIVTNTANKKLTQQIINTIITTFKTSKTSCNLQNAVFSSPFSFQQKQQLKQQKQQELLKQQLYNLKRLYLKNQFRSYSKLLNTFIISSPTSIIYGVGASVDAYIRETTNNTDVQNLNKPILGIDILSAYGEIT